MIKTLIIEDNENNMYLISYLLENSGQHQIYKAYDGQRGLTLAKDVRPDLILLDIQLPIMSGYEVAEALRHDQHLGNIPIVAITSYAMPGDREKALQAGCNGYITKPIDPDSFLAELESYLRS